MTIQVLRISILVLLATTASAHLQCEDLRPEECAFAVASSGARCNLETYPGKNGEVMHECQTSMVMAEAKEEYIENSECISACGVERMTIGLSTDILMEKKFIESLCSPDCVEQCPNIFDLYIKLAAGEGLYLPQICKSQPVKPRKQHAGRKETTNMKVMENPRAMGKPFGKPGPVWRNIWKGSQQSAQVNPPLSAPPHWSNRGGIWDSIPPTSSPSNPRSWSSSPTPPWTSSPTSPQYPPAAEAPSSSRDFNYQPHNTPQPWSPYASPSESPSPQPWSPYPSPSESPSPSSLPLPPSPSPFFGMPTTSLPPSPSPFSESTTPSPSPSELPSPSESPLPSESLAPSPSENLAPSPSEALAPSPSPSFSSNSRDFFFQSPPYPAPSLSPQHEFPSPNSLPPSSHPTPSPITFQAPAPL